MSRSSGRTRRWKFVEVEQAVGRPATQTAIARDYAELSADQRAAAADIFRNRDRIRALEGIAGAGKTATLAAVRDAADRDGYAVKGLAPTGRAAHQLADIAVPRPWATTCAG